MVLAGNNPASEVYVRNKIKTVNDAGCRGELFRLDQSASLSEALALVQTLNADDAVDGILVQSPLPEGMGAAAEQRVFDAVNPAKDVDGFHPYNVGMLVQKRPTLVACTPLGCIELLEREGIPMKGKTAVVIGRSDIVGKPMALLLLHRDATVTICHSRTVGLAEQARTADILVAAIGRPAFVTREYVKPGATVIDVGINALTQQPDVLRMEAVHVLGGIDRVEDPLFRLLAHAVRQRRLHQDGVDAGISVELANQRQRFVERGCLVQPMQLGPATCLADGLDLVANVHFRGGILAGQYDRQRRRPAVALRIRRNARRDIFTNTGGTGHPVKLSRRH